MTLRIIESSIWSIVQRYVPSVVQILATLAITRTIAPGDFGEVALVTTINQIAILLVSSGLGEGLIFNSDNSEIKYSSVFYFNLAVSGLIYTSLFFASFHIATFYNIPRLSLLIKIISINILLYAVSYIQRIIHQKNLNFKFLAYVSIIATFTGSSVGLFLASQGYGVWSIVILVLTINFLETGIIWFKSKWRPLSQFSWYEVKNILSYSLKILFNNIIQVIYDNTFSLVIGKSLGIRPLGVFNRMQTVVYFTTTNFLYSLESVFFPILCRNKQDQIQIRESYEKLLRISTLFTWFILTIFVTLSQQIVIIVLTDKWSEGIPVLRMISIAFLFVPISYINNSFLKITNNTSALLYGNILKKAIGLIILIITIFLGELDIICKGIVIYYSIDALLSMVLTHVYLRIKITDQIRYLLKNFILVMIASAISYTTLLVDSVYVSFLYGMLIISTVFIGTSAILKTREYIIIKKLFDKHF